MRHYLLIFVGLVSIGLSDQAYAAESAKDALKDEPIEFLDDEKLPPRTPPPIELGPKFLGTGNIVEGFTLPTGAVWTPSLWVFGNYRSAVQFYEDESGVDNSEWANRLDLFANLQLSGTERVVLGVTPLHDRDAGNFAGKVFSPDSAERTNDDITFEIDTLFFEGDLAEIFPNWDVFDSKKNDIGFTVGRQSVVFSEGLIVADNMDGIGFSKNNIRFAGNPNIINWRSSIFFGWNGVHRGDNNRDRDAEFYGWFNQIDTIKSTYNVNVAYVDSENNDDLINIGVDMTRRFGKMNASVRAAVSHAPQNETAQASDGAVLLTELSWIPDRTHDNLYLNGFIAIDDYTAAARGPLNGGPLGRTGLLFAAQGIGTFPSPLANDARDAVGAALGYQKFSKNKRTQWTFEAGARFDSENLIGIPDQEFGVGARWQQAVGHRSLVQVDTFVTTRTSDDVAVGARLEFQVKL